MKVIIRTSADTSYFVTIPDNSTVKDLMDSAVVACPSDAKLPQDFKLIYNGQKLAPYYQTLEAFGVDTAGSEITVILMNSGVEIPLASPDAKPSEAVPKKKASKKRCSFPSCTSVPLRIVGDCSHCQGKFCAKHRLLEDHMCSGLQICKDSAHERNAMKLQSERTISSKV